MGCTGERVCVCVYTCMCVSYSIARELFSWTVRGGKDVKREIKWELIITYLFEAIRLESETVQKISQQAFVCSLISLPKRSVYHTPYFLLQTKIKHVCVREELEEWKHCSVAPTF